MKNGQSQGSRAVDRMKPDLCRQARWVSRVVQQRRDRIQGDTFMFLLSWLRPWEEVKKLEEDLLCGAETFLENLASTFVLRGFREINRLHSWAGSSCGIFGLSIKNATVRNLLQIKTNTRFVPALWGNYSCLFS